MADPISKLDDPDNISAFLRMIGGSAKLNQSSQKFTNSYVVNTTNEENQPSVNEDTWAQEEAVEADKKDSPENDSAGSKTPAVRSRAPSSAASTPFQPGINAPPSTPATGAVTADNNSFKLEPIEEDESDVWAQLADASTKTLKDSKYATKGNLRYPVQEFKSATLPRNFSPPKQSPPMKIRAPCINLSPITGYMDRVVGHFHKKLEPSADIDPRKHTDTDTGVAEAKINEPEEKPEMLRQLEKRILELEADKKKNREQVPSSNVDTKETELKTQEHKHHTTAVNGDQLRVSAGEPWPMSNPATKADSAHAVKPAKPTVATPTTQNEMKVSQDVARVAQSESPEAAAPVSDQRQSVDAGPLKFGERVQRAEEEEEDREHLTHFKSWGTQVARSTPAARIRKVTISGLPADVTDLTLVQGLVSGGAIENYILASSCTVAHVTFTTADVCDAFCKKYANGLPFKYYGRSYTAFVDKSKDVDVISGMLQGFIEAGASRCVRATGADEDWGMRALQRLAEGRSRKGKVESILDVYKNAAGVQSLIGDGSATPKKIRTIVFRFTSIADAVQFRGMLLREEDWEASNIQFMDDPCAKATGVHLE